MPARKRNDFGIAHLWRGPECLLLHALRRIAVPEEKKLDATGLFCPEPVFRAKIELERMQAGDTLVVTADDPAAEDDISRWASRSGHKVSPVSRDGQRVTLSITK